MAGRRIVAILGSYRRDGTCAAAVREILAAAADAGAETLPINLLDRRVEFCANCRSCTQAPGPARGRCVHDDDLDGILAEVERADALVLAAPVNLYNVNALTRRFMERLAGFAHWPWGRPGPKIRNPALTKEAVLVTSSAMPAPLGRLFTGAVRALKATARLLGARPTETIFIGLAAQRERQPLAPKIVARCRRAGRRLAGARGENE